MNLKYNTLTPMRLLAIVVLLATPALGWSAEAVFLALKSDGTASLVIDEPAKTAWITDGGRGRDEGITTARIGKKGVVDYLIGKKIQHLIITCSHPHEDHDGGLKQIVESPAIKKIPLVTFVDSEVPKSESLFELYKATHGEAFAKDHARSQSATNRDALGSIEVNKATVKVSNFVYSPAGNSDPHGRPVITQYEFSGKKSRTLVDFDDAATSLVKRWADRKDARANVVVHPHHGSKDNKIDSLLANATRIGLEDVIITVNRNNRYRHPDPATFLRLVRQLGVDHVFITDSDVGENVTVDEFGTRDGRTAENHRARLRAFVVAQVEKRETRLRDAIDKNSLGVSAKVLFAADERGRREALLGSMTGVDEKIARAVLRDVNALADYAEILKTIDGEATRKSVIALGTFRGPEPGGAPSPKNRLPAPNTPSGGADNYFAQLDLNQRDLKASSNSTRGPRALYQHEVQSSKITWGGIVFGNDVTGPRVLDVTFLDDGEEGESKQPIVRVRIEGGGYADYAGATNSELWSAYNFVQPDEHLKERYSHSSVVGNGGGIIGIGSDAKIALNPAVAGTKLGWDAIFTDSLREIATSAETKNAIPVEVAEVDWKGLLKFWIQWSDAPMTVRVEYGAIRVEPSSGPKECALRLRTGKPPSGDKVRAAGFRAVKVELAKDAKSLSGSLSSKYSDPDSLSTEDMRFIAAYLSKARIAGIEAIGAEKAKAFYEDERQWVSERFPTERLLGLCGTLSPVVRMDRLARTIALLNWIRESTNSSLPPLPDWVQPEWAETPSNLEDDVTAKWGVALETISQTEASLVSSTRKASYRTLSEAAANLKSVEAATLESWPDLPRRRRFPPWGWAIVGVIVVIAVAAVSRKISAMRT